MTTLEAVVLGAVQGLTEFLPVSSSGHLVLASEVMRTFGGSGDLADAERLPLAFVVLVHAGSLLAIVGFFHREFLSLLTTRRGLIPRLVLGMVPAGLAFVVLKVVGKAAGVDVLEVVFEKPLPVGFAMLVTGTVLWVTERVARDERSLDGVSWLDALVIGVAQAVALVPGISRSGMTVGAGLARGLERRAAVAFAFLLGAVAIAGGTVLELRDMGRLGGQIGSVPLVAGFLASAVVSVVSLALLTLVVRRKRLFGFAIYCYVVGLGVVLAKATGAW